MDAADVAVWSVLYVCLLALAICLGNCLWLTRQLRREVRKRRRAERIADGAVALNRTLVACNDQLMARLYRRQALKEPSRN